MSELHFVEPAPALTDGATTLVVVGTSTRLRDGLVSELLPRGVRDAWLVLLDRQKPADEGSSAELWDAASGIRLVAVVLPEVCSRHNCPARPDAITRGVQKALGDRGAVTALVLALELPDHALAAVCAVARAVPLYGRKGEADSSTDSRSELRVAVLAPDGPVLPSARVVAAAAGVRTAARLTDMPASELHTDAYLEELRAVAGELGVDLEVLRGEQLEAGGYGGLWAIGRTAVHPPALAVLRHEPAEATRTVCWVGKGIVYDTGGLSLKGKEFMPGMKADMGGSAAVLGAFVAAVRAGFRDRLHAVFCLAENSVGPQSVRPDDILTLYSGKTVEVNNTDAEGRLVLADGVAHAVAHLDPDVIVDLATLTGAQLIATGKRHAAIVANDEDIERQALLAGRRSGDLVHALPYCPEFHRQEFSSKVADLKNSVKDRANAQSSCAAQFIAESLGSYPGPWLHVDLAGPASRDDRATGFGVALLVEMFVPEVADSGGG